MADIVFLALIIGFFAMSLLLVRGCERIIGTEAQGAGPARRQPAPEPELVRP